LIIEHNWYILGKSKTVMIATAKLKQAAVDFPEADVIAALIEFWNEEALQRSADPLAPVPKTTGTLYDLLPALDSLTIVCGLLVIERVLGMDVPVGIVKAGGYHSREDMLNDLLPKLRELYDKKRT
jgi:hypothetical protein